MLADFKPDTEINYTFQNSRWGQNTKSEFYLHFNSQCDLWQQDFMVLNEIKQQKPSNNVQQAINFAHFYILQEKSIFY